MSELYVVDIGGTKIECIRMLDNNFTLHKIFTPNTGSFLTDMEILDSWFRSLVKNPNKKITISFSGLIKNEVVIKWPNKVYWENHNLVSHLKIAFSSQYIDIYEDCNMGAFSSAYLFCSTKNSLYINVGTGIGMGLFINGQIYHGDQGFAGELGHTVICFESEETCTCGKKGCLQIFSSGRGMLNQLKQASENWNKSELQYELLYNYNIDKVREIITRGARFLGIALSNLVCVLDITSLHIGGSVLNNQLYRKILIDTLVTMEQKFLDRNIKVVISPFNNTSLAGTFLKATNYYNLTPDRQKNIITFIENHLLQKTNFI